MTLVRVVRVAAYLNFHEKEKARGLPGPIVAGNRCLLCPDRSSTSAIG